MFRKSLLPALICGLLVSAVQSAMLEDLPQAVQLAREQLAATTPDSNACRTLADDLVRLAGVYPKSSLVPDALWLASRLERAGNRLRESCALAYRVMTEFPRSDVAPAAFEWVWNDLTHEGAIPVLGADLARVFADQQSSPQAAGPYCLRAFEGFRSANRWPEAAEVATRYLEECPSCSLSAPLLLDMAEVSLQTGDMENARHMLMDFLSRYRELPQVVPAHVKLAFISESLSQSDAAHEHYSLAWSAFQKHANESAYRQPEISHSAAQALYRLQQEPLRAFAQLVSVSEPFREKTARGQAEELEKALTQVMLADEDFAPACFNAIGNLHRQLGDALLAEGNRRANFDPKTEPPYASAMPEYTRAVAAYSQAFEKTRQEPHDTSQDHPDWQAASTYAAHQACEVTLGQGDAVYGWALELFGRAPQTDPGASGNSARHDYLVNTVVPLLCEGGTYTSRALDLTARLKTTSTSRESLDLPFRPVAEELAKIQTEQTQQAAAVSTQISKSMTFGFQLSSTASRADELADFFDRARGTAMSTQAALASLYDAVRLWQPPLFWDSLMATASYDYAGLCRSLQSDLSVALASLTTASDEQAQRFRARLTKLQTACATEEYSSLVRWHDWAAQHGVKLPLGDRLEARLAELDPSYGGPDDFPSANRRRP